MNEQELAERFDDEDLTKIGRAIHLVESAVPEGNESRFSEEVARELGISRLSLLNAVSLRLGEIALEVCPEEDEKMVMDAATTLANPRKADPDEIRKAKETIAQYL